VNFDFAVSSVMLTFGSKAFDRKDSGSKDFEL